MSRICKECKVTKLIEEFDGGRKMCRNCGNLIRRKGNEKNKICLFCNTAKHNSGYRRNQKICKDCENSDDMIGKKMCNICDVIKKSTDFFGIQNSCKDCVKKQKNEKLKEMKNCEKCLINKEYKDFRGILTKICLACEDDSIKRKCSDCGIEKSITYFTPPRAKCHDCEKADGRLYRRTTTKAKEWVEKNPEKMSQLQKKYYEENKKKIRNIESNRKKTDDDYREVKNCKKNISVFIRGNHKTSKKLCISRDKYILWLEYNFKDSMNMENYKEVWCIDHVIPLSSLYKSLNNECFEFIRKIANHKKLLMCWYNTIPTTQKENRLKSNKIDEEILKLHFVNIKSFFNQNKNIKKDELYCEYKNFIKIILDFLYKY